MRVEDLVPRGSRHPRSIRAWASLIATAILLSGIFSIHNGVPVEGQERMTVLLRDSFRYEPSLIVAEPGENVSLHMLNDGVAPHTFTLFAAPNAAPPYADFARLRDFYEQGEKIVDVRLLGGNETDVDFVAPAIDANYAIVCMEVGHAANGMVAVLQVGEGQGPGPSVSFPLGPIQTLMIIALAGAVVFAVFYHVRSTRGGRS